VILKPAVGLPAPLKGLKPLWRELREPQHRLKKAGLERLKDGSIAKNPQRMGPLTLRGAAHGLERVLGIQAECNAGGARAQGRPTIT
jgi:DNA sulfur modification protein DndC